jgi:hypothetical protein
MVPPSGLSSHPTLKDKKSTTKKVLKTLVQASKNPLEMPMKPLENLKHTVKKVNALKKNKSITRQQLESAGSGNKQIAQPQGEKMSSHLPEKNHNMPRQMTGLNSARISGVKSGSRPRSSTQQGPALGKKLVS